MKTHQELKEQLENKSVDQIIEEYNKMKKRKKEEKQIYKAWNIVLVISALNILGLLAEILRHTMF